MKKIVDKVKAQPNLWSDTAIIITFEEGGSYYYETPDYVQALDYFGDGTRIPTIVVSPYTKPGISRMSIPITSRFSNSSQPIPSPIFTKSGCHR